MEILTELPQENRKYPSFKVIEGKVDLQIGPTCLGWRLGIGQKVRFNRHGTFTVEQITSKGVAFIHASFPRKGWNPKGPTTSQIMVLPKFEVTIRKGAVYTRNVPPEEWQQIESRERSRREYREKREHRGRAFAL